MVHKSLKKDAGRYAMPYFKALLFEIYPLRISFAAILILTAVAYGNCLNNGFVWDDETFIVNNKYIHDLSRWTELFTEPKSVSTERILSQMYRPLQTLSFAIDAAIWDNRAGGFHLTSLLLHVASCMAIIYAFRALTGSKPAIISAFIFAIHPALSEGVLSLASRGNQLYTFFALLSLGLFIRTSRVFDKNHVLSILTAALALFSKEPAIAFLALLPLIQAVFGLPWKVRDRRSFLLYVPFLITAGIYLVLRADMVTTTKVIPYWGGSLWATLQMQAKVFVIYLYLLIFPFNLKGRYSIAPPLPFPDLLVTGAIILNISLIALAAVIYNRGNKGRLLSLSIAWFYISLAPTANLIPVPGSMMGERFLYFTLAGALPLLTAAAFNLTLTRFRTTLLIIGTVIVMTWIITDIRRTSDWRDNLSFFTLLSKQEPDNPIVQILMAREEIEAHDAASAVIRIERIIHAGISSPLVESKAKLHYWYGKALLESNRFEEAFREFSIYGELLPEYSKEVLLLRTEAAARSGDITTARILLEEGIRSSPEDDFLWNGLGNIQLIAGDIPGAIFSYKKALAINPRNTQAAINLQNALRSR